MKKKRLAIISSHPIQYNAPMFALLAKSKLIEPKVFYTWSQSNEKLFDKDFGKEIKWDIPLLEGYEYQFVKNTSKYPGPHGFKGIDCPTINKEIEAWKADALLVFGWNYKAHYKVMSHFKGKIPVYFRGDSTLLDESAGMRQWVRRLALKYVYSHCDGAFYVGDHNKNYFLIHGFKETELYFAPHAIDNERFSANEQIHLAKALNWRREMGIELTDKVVLFVGKFEPKKNPLLLLKAFRNLNRTDSQLVFVGNGFLEEEMRKEAEGQVNIHFMPFQNQQSMPAVYRIGDLLALPSQGPGETWGLVVNEAMACKRAVLISNKAGCAPNLVEDGMNGYVFASGNFDDCVNKLNLMLRNEIDLEKMGKNGREKIEQWSFREIVKSLELNI
ncbi:MAG: glycosyltransferase family 4 protein [Bacteroidales bacterium]